MTETEKIEVAPTTIIGNIFGAKCVHWTVCLLGISNAFGVALAIEWKDHFEKIRHVPPWETLIVAGLSTVGGLYLVYLVLRTVERRSNRA